MIYVTKLIISGKLKLVLQIFNIKCGKIIKIIWKIPFKLYGFHRDQNDHFLRKFRKSPQDGVNVIL
jgi:hypothetical protein